MNPNNLDLLEDIHKMYLKDPSSIDSSWASVFENMDVPAVVISSEKSTIYEKPVKHYAEVDKSSSADLRIYNLINAYRTYGHLLAEINPIAIKETDEPWQLSLEHLGFSKEELNQQFPTCGLLSKQKAPLHELIETLRCIYCGKIGVEYMGLQRPELEEWLQEHIEKTKFKVELSIEQKKMILHQLNRSELFEIFIHTKYTGQKRFSLEGGETLIPMLEALIETGSALGLEQFFIGMAHRGRLNVLSNILNKSHADIFSEFEDNYIPNSFEGTGDVKYHKGFTSEVKLPNQKKVQVILSPNPSHLESVDPVVEGQTKAKQIMDKDSGTEKVVPILIHGDAALPGQGVVYETMQLYQIPGYSTGGTIHFVINNQIGFTATPSETRSTFYCTDIARAFGAPVFHVNAEEPEGCVYATNLAIQLRQKFHCDVFIDLNCYRKYGHNESDEPAYTQPLEYQIIRKKKPIREIYRDQLIQQGVLEKEIAENLEKEFTQGLQQALKEVKDIPLSKEVITSHSKAIAEWKKIDTGVSKDTLKIISEKISFVPEGFSIHPKLKNLVQERLSMVKEESKSLDWGMAELLAYGTILWEGNPIRISGQDCRRGTFSHRHAIWMDQVQERAYVPLQHLKDGQGRFDVYNSPLSEYAVLGFEYGYSLGNPGTLVIWEAQFGDFANGAQVTIDQYIASAEQKWIQKAGITLFLPHGYEGQGPEHSSGRLERFLMLCGENNMRVVNPTTPAQLFHLLRLQVKDPIKKPLIVFTPKAILRHPECISKLDEFTKGSFQETIEFQNGIPKKILFCSGKIFYDIVSEGKKRSSNEYAIIRLEQLYPFPKEKIEEILNKYAQVKEFIWVQEEPKNMGAWEFIHPQLEELLSNGQKLHYVGRKRSAAPAAGSYVIHKKQYAEIMDELFNMSNNYAK